MALSVVPSFISKKFRRVISCTSVNRRERGSLQSPEVLSRRGVIGRFHRVPLKKSSEYEFPFHTIGLADFSSTRMGHANRCRIAFASEMEEEEFQGRSQCSP